MKLRSFSINFFILVPWETWTQRVQKIGKLEENIALMHLASEASTQAQYWFDLLSRVEGDGNSSDWMRVSTLTSLIHEMITYLHHLSNLPTEVILEGILPFKDALPDRGLKGTFSVTLDTYDNAIDPTIPSQGLELKDAISHMQNYYSNLFHTPSALRGTHLVTFPSVFYIPFSDPIQLSATEFTKMFAKPIKKKRERQNNILYIILIILFLMLIQCTLQLNADIL